MKAHIFRMATLVLLAGLITTGPAAGFDIPKIPGVGDIGDVIEDITDIDYILNNLGGFGLGTDQEEPITTSLDDAVTEVPFLDNYPAAPVTGGMNFLPICELPRGTESNHILMPGRYAGTIETFCLHAGTYGPGHGGGYLYAPLKGPWSDIVRDILRNSENHPEISQRDVQVLVWAVLARTKPSDMTPEMREVVQLLLTPEQIAEISASAFEVIPEDLMGEVFQYVDVPPAIEEVMQAQAEIRWMMTNGYSSFDELEAIAVLTGDPVPTGEDREIPETRWSYHPDGYFMRYFPHGYSSTDIEMAIPDSFSIELQDRERISAVEDEHSNRLEVDGTTLRFTCLDPRDPNSTLDQEWSGFDVDRLVEAGWVRTHRSEVESLVGQSQWVDTIVEVGKFARAVEAVASGDLGGRAADVAKEAWMDAVVRVTQTEQAGSENRVAKKAGSGLPDFDWRDRWRPFDPTDDTVTPGDRGRQRLGGRDPRPSEDPEWGGLGNMPEYDPNKRPAANNTREADADFNKKMNVIVDFSPSPIMGLAGSLGFAIPKAVLGSLIEMVTGLWDYCTDAISQDPPRDDYTEIAEPEHFIFPPLVSPQDGPAERVAAQNAFIADSLEVGAWLKAAAISIDRLGGASQAGDEYWSFTQAKALVYNERQAGYAMYRLADSIDEYLAELRSEGIEDIYVTPDAFRERQRRLETEGFSPEQLEAARILGMSDDMLSVYKDYVLSVDPDEAAGSVMESAERLSDAFREFGQYLITLPDVTQQDLQGSWVEVSP